MRLYKSFIMKCTKIQENLAGFRIFFVPLESSISVFILEPYENTFGKMKLTLDFADFLTLVGRDHFSFNILYILNSYLLPIITYIQN